MPRHSRRFYLIVAGSIVGALLFSVWFFAYKAFVPGSLGWQLGGTWQAPVAVVAILAVATAALYVRGRQSRAAKVWLLLRVCSNVFLVSGLLGLILWRWTSPIVITLVFGAAR